jgi:predicted MPP superfamily phosphohydrolase
LHYSLTSIFGKKNNSSIHNQDCLDFISWFADEVRKDGSIEAIGFLGDWYENRSAINISTLDYSYKGAKIVDDLCADLKAKCYFDVGNHDLHRRTTRDVHSVNIFNEFSNFVIVDKPTIVENEFLFCPFLFDEEYKDLAKFNHLKAWFGHFEFRNFAITGYNTIMEHGPDHTLFTGPDFIFSGHFHKRQSKDNVVFIGNTFPMDFGDAGDIQRGMCIYDSDTKKVEFINWDDCPRYARTTLSKVVDPTWSATNKSYVKCLVDIDITYSEAQAIKEAMIEQFDLRSFILEENKTYKKELLEGEDSDDTLDDFVSLDDLVVKKLESIEKNDIIDPSKLIALYRSIKVDL